MVNNKKSKNFKKKQGNNRKPLLSDKVRSKVFGVALFTFSLILILSFFEKAGVGGNFFLKSFTLLIGEVVFIFPFVLFFLSLLFFKTESWKLYLLGTVLFILGISGSLSLPPFDIQAKLGGSLGYLISWPLSSLFGSWVSQIIFLALTLIGALILFQPFLTTREKEPEEEKKPSLIKKIFTPQFRVKEIDPVFKQKKVIAEEEKATSRVSSEFKPKSDKKEFDNPSLHLLNLLEKDVGTPAAGDIKNNSAIIKKTLQNFGISVEMGEVNIGPTVTQYTLKPAEGIKLSRIISLNNDLSLALAAHPIRIEAPIPGKSMVGIELPNKVRTLVRMRSLTAHPDFQGSSSNLSFVLGRDVTGRPVFVDLARMPHLLMAGATGAGKTIGLNNLIISLLYQNSPEMLKLILIDPKRVEFPVYDSLPHLLTPVIFDVNYTVSALKWLINEMERRFEVIAAKKARDIIGYNKIAKKEEFDQLFKLYSLKIVLFRF